MGIVLLNEQPIVPVPDKGGSYIQTLKQLVVGSGDNIFYVDSQGSLWGGRTFDTAKAWIKPDGTFSFKDGSGNVLVDSAGTDGNFVNLINSTLNTQTKQILSDFTFGASGAIKIITDENNGIWISPTGILGKKAGNVTFALETDGDATFGGSLVAASGTLGAITVGTNAWHVDSSGNMWWGSAANYAAATYKIGADGSANLSGLTVGTNVGLGTAQDSNGVTTIIGNTVTTGYVNALGVTAGSVSANNVTAGTITGSTIVSNSDSYRIILDASNRRLGIYNGETLKGAIYCDGDGDLKIYSWDDLVFNVPIGYQYRFRIGDSLQQFLDNDGDWNPRADNTQKVGTLGYAYAQMNAYNFNDHCLWLDEEDDLAILRACRPKYDKNGNIRRNKDGKPELDTKSLPDWMHTEKELREEIEQKGHDYNEDEIQEMIGRNMGHFLDLTAGAVRQLANKVDALETKI